MASKIDVNNHILVPKHSKLSEEETKKLLLRLNITPKQLPRILSKDPALASFKCKEGDIIKIERNSETAGKSLFYRCVVNA